MYAICVYLWAKNESGQSSIWITINFFFPFRSPKTAPHGRILVFRLLSYVSQYCPSWGGSYINQHGRISEECLALHNVSTYFNLTHHTWSTIDLVLVSASLLDKILAYVHKDLSGSDHAPILATLNLSSSNPSSATSPRRNFQNTDWHPYHSVLAENVPFDLAFPSNTLVEQFSLRPSEVACLCSLNQWTTDIKTRPGGPTNVKWQFEIPFSHQLISTHS